MRPLLLLFAGLLAAGPLQGQSPGVPIVEERRRPDPDLMQAARKLRSESKLMPADTVLEQLKRTSCVLKLPRARRRTLDGRELWQRARSAHVRIGYFYKCTKCMRWHLSLAGGYALTTDGAVATCHHVVEPRDSMEEGYLIAATAEGRLLPVTGILAASQRTDACIVRVETNEPFEPLPLNPRVSPGDQAWCFSDPAGQEGYFTQGIVNRFFRHRGRDEDAPIRMNVSTDWAPGSSGAAVIDSCGNAIGHVSRISARGGDTLHDAHEVDEPTETLIVFHSAVRAADVLALVKPH